LYITTDSLECRREKPSAVFGNQIDDDGVLVHTATDKPPYFSVGFMSEKSNHKYRYVWLYKVRAKPVTKSYATKEGGIIIQQTGEVEWTIHCAPARCAENNDDRNCA
jgi:phi13 family phage major tail protein